MSIQPAGPSYFQTTAWSAVIAARQPGTGDFSRGMDYLCRTYWKPVYHFLRRRGYKAELAKDLTQEYFRSFLEKNIPGKACRERGKFRTFVLATLQQFLLSQRRALRRREIPVENPENLPGHAARPPRPTKREEALSPEEIFNRRWARTLIANAMEAMRRFCRDEQRRRYYQVLQTYLDGVSAGQKPSYRKLAAQFETSETSITNWLHRGRNIFHRFLREEIGESVLSEREVDEELRDLRRYFA